MCARRKARDFENLLLFSKIPLEVMIIDIAVPRVQPGDVDVVDQGNKVQIRLQNSLLISPSCIRMGICGLSLTSERQSRSGE